MSDVYANCMDLILSECHCVMLVRLSKSGLLRVRVRGRDYKRAGDIICMRLYV